MTEEEQDLTGEGSPKERDSAPDLKRKYVADIFVSLVMLAVLGVSAGFGYGAGRTE